MIFLFFGILAVTFLGFWWTLQKRISYTESQLKESFKSLSFDAMEKNSKLFLGLASSSMEPFKETLKQIDAHQRELEKKRVGAYSAITTQLEGMALAEKELRKEMVRLTQSLRSPQMRGSWGQIHLKRVIELAGMLNHCDFFEQESVMNEGKIYRPDLLVRLPGERHIVIDAKTPLNAYLDASDAGDDDLRKKKLLEHAASLKRHIKELSGKEYWKQFDQAPEYVILFLPAEAFYSAALQADPTLIEVGADQNILIATPTTLIAILRAVAITWKQESLSKNAKEIADLGQELYSRIAIFCEHWNKVGKNLNSAVEAFNQSTSSMETRVLVSARKLKEIGQIQKDLPELTQIEKIAKSLS